MGLGSRDAQFAVMRLHDAGERIAPSIVAELMHAAGAGRLTWLCGGSLPLKLDAVENLGVIESRCRRRPVT